MSSPWDSSVVTHSLPQALKSRVFSSFFLLWIPAEVKSVKLQVYKDKSTKGSNFPPSEVAIGLSPYTFPHEWPSHVPEEENIAWAGVRLAGPLHSSLLGCCRNQGSSTRQCASSTVIREACTPAMTMAAVHVSQRSGARPPDKAHGTTSRACQGSSARVTRGFPREPLNQRKTLAWSFKDALHS